MSGLIAAAFRLSPRELLRSGGVRFGVIYAGLFGISALALGAFLWWSTAGLLNRQTNESIYADMDSLTDVFNDEGLDALADAIAQRVNFNVDDDAVYLLVNDSFQRLAGNLDHWPGELTIDSPMTEILVERTSGRTPVRVMQHDLALGLHLLVGRDVGAREHLQHMITDAMLWSAGIAIALGVIGAWTVRGLFRATIADVSAVAAAVSAGDLTRRVTVLGQGDEFDLMAEAINDMLDRITRLMDGVRQVSNAIAHDLRTPITRARARLEDAATHSRSEDELRAALERGQADLDDIVAIFQALLRIAEIEAGARRAAFAPVDLAPLLQDLAELYDAAAEERGQVLATDLPAALPVFGDRDMIQQAVANLLDNAMKFTPGGGRITLSAAAEPGGATITVADNGPGIPAEQRERVTERFYRVESARSTPGSGLGLALVQAVAALHGRGLALEDNAPGLRVVLHLPAAESGKDRADERHVTS
jgi:signal transduction histidine kinase